MPINSGMDKINMDKINVDKMNRINITHSGYNHLSMS